MKKISALLALFVLAFGLSAQDFDKAKMDSLFSRIELNQKGMGGFSIFKEGKEVYQNSFGYADIKNGIRATESTIYRIGSISKSFTATIIMQLIDESKLKLSSLLSDFFLRSQMLMKLRSNIF
jgi:D-alanyl-D-alanine carboxypeptidase